MPTITDWLMVGITFVYVVATVFICVFNGRSAKAAKRQTEEMQKQFYATNRPIVTVEIVYLKRAFWALRFTNHGTQTAFNTKIQLDESFIDSIPEPTYQRLLRNDNGKVRTIGVNQHYDLFFGSNQYRDAVDKTPIRGRVIYKGWNESVYAEDFEIETQNYATFFSVNSDIEDLMKKIQEQTKELKEIRGELLLLRKIGSQKIEDNTDE